MTVKSRVNEKKRWTLSNPKVLCGLSIFLLLLGETVMDPVAGIVDLFAAFVLAAAALRRGSKPVRIFALVILIVVVVLGISLFPDAAHHFSRYTSRAR